jgi:hypothetical protein
MTRERSSDWNIQVKSIDVVEVKKLLKDCPKEVQEYVKSIEGLLENYKDLVAKSISKIRELSKQNNHE